MCQSPIKSSLCPGPKLPSQIQADSDFDRRCRGCKRLAAPKVGKNVALPTLDDKPAKISATSRAERVQRAQDRLGQLMTRDTNSTKPVGLGYGEKWAVFAEAFLIDVFDELCNGIPPGPFALVVAGSLARKQATPFSDLEFFFVIEQVDHIVPFAKLARKVWKTLEEVHNSTGSFDKDVFFSKSSAYNALTTTASCLHYDNDRMRPKYDPLSLKDNLELFSFGDATFEQFSGARCTAGDPSLLESLKLNLRMQKIPRPVLEFREKLDNNIIPAIHELLRDLKEGKSTVNLKEAILRTLLWVTICLGRCYDLQGIGDRAQVNLLTSRGKISKAVAKLMLDTLNYAQTARYQAHVKAKAESDKVALNPQLKRCLRTVSALVEMSDVWLKKKTGKATKADQKRDCLKTSHPERYDYFKSTWTAT
jgi:hypothetical protein